LLASYEDERKEVRLWWSTPGIFLVSEGWAPATRGLPIFSVLAFRREPQARIEFDIACGGAERVEAAGGAR
jgi:hypothetical protein